MLSSEPGPRICGLLLIVATLGGLAGASDTWISAGGGSGRLPPNDVLPTPPLNVSWSVDLGCLGSNSLFGATTRWLIAPCRDGALVLDPVDGTILGEIRELAECGPGVFRSPLIIEGIVIMSLRDCIVAHDIAENATKWVSRLPEAQRGEIILSQGKVLVPQIGVLYALELTSGAIAWKMTSNSTEDQAIRALHGLRTAIAPIFDGVIWCSGSELMRLTSLGEVVWRIPIGGASGYGPIAVGNETVLVSIDSNQGTEVRAFSLFSGIPAWRVTTMSSAIVAASDVLYVPDFAESIGIINVLSPDGTRLTHVSGLPTPTAGFLPSVAGVFVASGSTLEYFGYGSGGKSWTRSFLTQSGDRDAITQIASADGLLFVRGLSGQLVALSGAFSAPHEVEISEVSFLPVGPLAGGPVAASLGARSLVAYSVHHDISLSLPNRVLLSDTFTLRPFEKRTIDLGSTFLDESDSGNITLRVDGRVIGNVEIKVSERPAADATEGKQAVVDSPEERGVSSPAAAPEPATFSPTSQIRAPNESASAEVIQPPLISFLVAAGFAASILRQRAGGS